MADTAADMKIHECLKSEFVSIGQLQIIVCTLMVYIILIIKEVLFRDYCIIYLVNKIYMTDYVYQDHSLIEIPFS